MIAPKFIRFQGDLINITKIVDVCFNSEKQQTAICYGAGEAVWARYDGDHRDEIWDLIKLALSPKDKDVSYPVDTTHLERRINGIEEKIGENFTAKNRKSDELPPQHVGFTFDGTPIYARRDGSFVTL